MFSRLFNSPVHLVILVLIIVVIFGWKRLPDAARSLGRSARILKSEVDEMGKESRASNQTVKGETTEGASGATAASETRVPGEAPTTPPAAGQAQQPRATNDTTGN